MKDKEKTIYVYLYSLNPFHSTGLFPNVCTKDSMMFSGGRERDQWHKMGQMLWERHCRNLTSIPNTFKFTH